MFQEHFLLLSSGRIFPSQTVDIPRSPEFHKQTRLVPVLNSQQFLRISCLRRQSFHLELLQLRRLLPPPQPRISFQTLSKQSFFLPQASPSGPHTPAPPPRQEPSPEPTPDDSPLSPIEQWSP